MKKIFFALNMATVVLANPVVDQAVSQLNSYAQVQKQLGVQEPNLAYQMRKALVMADLLFDPQGNLQLGLTNDIKSAFLSATPLEYEVNMAKVLSTLDASWQPFFNSVTAPADSQLLRGLFSTETITNRHAKVAVMSAMLAPYNQGSVGDCFAVADVIRDHTEYFRNAAVDYRSIVMNGSISRPVNQSVDYFFYLPSLADDDLKRTFSFNASLLKAPGFAAARTLMGGDSVANLSDLVTKALQGKAQVTGADVIGAMAQAIFPANAASLRATGEYAFSCLTNNPVLRGVEAAFSAMAEDRPNDSLRQNINSALAQALRGVFSDSKSQQTFLTQFNNAYRLVYNLNIPLAQVSSDGSSTDGGFQLYLRSTDPHQIGTRIATPQDFQQAVLNVLAACKISDPRVLNFVHSDSFMQQVLWDFDPSNKKELHPVQNYQKLARTPMQCCDGDNPYEVDDIDTGTSYEGNVQTFTAKNTTALITWCMGLLPKAPAELLPMNSPQHAFNFVPANPDLSAFQKSGMSSSQWLQKALVVPGMQVANSPIDAATQHAFVQGLLSLGLENSSAFENLVKNLASKKLNVQTYAQKLLSGVTSLYRVDPNQAALLLDGLLLQALPANERAILEKSAIRFANTNWVEEGKDIYFCAFFNPRTAQIAFGSIFEDKTSLSPMDESAWVNNQQWDVDLMPYAPGLAMGN